MPAAACGALARLLEQFLDDETGGRRDQLQEVCVAIALLTESARRNGRTFSSG
jgi:hypothetical protein